MSNDLEIDFGLAEYQFELAQDVYRSGTFPIIDASVDTSTDLGSSERRSAACTISGRGPG